ncbi:MAG: glycosyltransferase [Pseudoxanthomonas sp.]|nr:glycosyltransferase [Pseudoxanthomonas sp.]
MAGQPEVSVIIPTWNRRGLVCRAIDSVLAQTRPVAQIVVVDDGSTDGTAGHLAERYGDRVTCLVQANAGVSAARNRGLAAATGRYIGLLDSDDVWLPEKTERQLDWLQRHPDFGMVLCDVQRVWPDGREIDVFVRRGQLPQDGPALRWLLGNPALAPLSVLFRREVWETVGGFDESLRTGEDLDWHLRVAARWPIGVVEATLARAVRGHDGLSSLQQTYDDYLRVIERAVDAAEGQVGDEVRHRALARALAHAAEGHVWQRRFADGWRAARRAWSLDPAQRGRLLRLLPMAVRRSLRALLPGRG